MTEENNQGVTEEAAVSQEQQQDPERQVPLSALEAVRAEKQEEAQKTKRLEDELHMIKEHLNLLQARQVQPVQQEESLSDDDVMTYGDFKKQASQFKREVEMTVGEMKMMKKHPDYQEVVTKHLPEVIKERPHLREYFQNNPDYQLAYDLAKSSSSFRTEHEASQRSVDAERIIENSQRNGSLSSAGGASAINEAKRFKDMPESEFRKLVNKNMGYS